jgi:catechol 2,3-dioxygenase-like lactoylglutathione lyase family enzyme
VEETRAATAAWEITGARHGGITVSEMDRSLEFYCGLLGLELVWRGELEEQVQEIVGVPEATSFDIAFLRIPGSETQVELLEYRGVEKISGATPPSHHGTGHFCVFVTDIESLYDDLAKKGVRFVSPGPIEMRTGPNRGGKSLYSLDPDSYVFEFHERPPRVG